MHTSTILRWNQLVISYISYRQEEKQAQKHQTIPRNYRSKQYIFQIFLMHCKALRKTTTLYFFFSLSASFHFEFSYKLLKDKSNFVFQGQVVQNKDSLKQSECLIFFYYYQYSGFLSYSLAKCFFAHFLGFSFVSVNHQLFVLSSLSQGYSFMNLIP